MVRQPRRRRQKGPLPVYDTTLKDILKQHVRDMLPVLLPGAVYEANLNVELIRPTIRVDKAYLIKYFGEDTVLNIEYESGSNEDMVLRLRVYNAVLHFDNKLPVISLVIYPFRTKMAQSPFKVHVGPYQLIDFRFFTLALFEEDAERYVREHIQCMYPLLPTMKGANYALIKQATDELVALYREDEVTLSQQIVWLELFLERTDTIPPPEKSEIQEHLKVYDLLWLENPKVQQIRAEGKREGKAEGIAVGKAEGKAEGIAVGKAEGKAEGIAVGKAEGMAEGVEALQRTLSNFINVRFPALSELAHQKLPHIKKLDQLELLTKQMYIAPDERVARFLLDSIEGK